METVSNGCAAGHCGLFLLTINWRDRRKAKCVLALQEILAPGGNQGHRPLLQDFVRVIEGPLTQQRPFQALESPTAPKAPR